MSKAIVLSKVLKIGSMESGRAWAYGKSLPDEELRELLWNDLASPAVSANAAMKALLEHQRIAERGISSKPSSRKEDETLTKFIRALKSASMSDAGDGMGILSLNGSSFPDHKDFKRTSLLVLDFYPKLLDRVSSMNDSLLTGVPGTGKSWWIWYAMHCLLNQEEPPDIVWDSFKHDMCVLFSRDKAYVGPRSDFLLELGRPSTWYFVDGKLPVWTAAQTVLVSSPERSVYHQWTKGREIKLTMPLWSLLEIKTLWRHSYKNRGLTFRRVKRNFDLWYGGVPRNVLERPSLLGDESRDNELVMAAIEDTSVEQARATKDGRYDSGTESSHFIIHQDGDRETFREKRREFSTKHVRSLFVREKSKHNTPSMISSDKAGPETPMGRSRGDLFEARGHKALCHGGDFEFRVVDSPIGVLPSLKSPMTVPPLIEVGFKGGHKSDIGGFADAVASNSGDVYLRPDNENHPLIDACIPPNILLNFKVSPGATKPNAKVLESHLQALPEHDEYFLDYFVTPSNYAAFKAPTLNRASDRARRLHVRVVQVNACKQVERCGALRRRI